VQRGEGAEPSPQIFGKRIKIEKRGEYIPNINTKEKQNYFKHLFIYSKYFREGIETVITDLRPLKLNAKRVKTLS
jgi:hypothetical protein